MALKSHAATFLFIATLGASSSSFAISPVEFSRDPATLEWVKVQNQVSREYLAADKVLQSAVQARAAELVPQNAPLRTSLMGYEFFVSKGSLVLAGQNGAPDRTVVDASKLAPGAVVTEFRVSPDKQKLAYGYAVYGTDWTTWNVISLGDLSRLAGPFYIKSSGFDEMNWDTDSNGLFYQAHVSASDDKKGLRNPMVKFHRLGTDSAMDQVVFLDTESPPSAKFQARALNSNTVIVHRIQGAAEIPFAIWLVKKTSDGVFSKKPIPVASNRHWGKLVGFDKKFLFVRTSEHGPNYSLVRIDLERNLESKIVVGTRADRTLIQAQNIGDKFVLHYLDNQLNNSLVITDRSGTVLKEFDPASLGLPRRATMGLLTGTSDSSAGWFAYHAADFPTETLRFDVATARVERVPGKPIRFDGTKVKSELHWYRSADGERIPVQVFTRTDLKTPPRFAYLFMYGNIGIASTTQFNRKFQLMLELGGMVALANIRGGGEFGLKWQKAGIFDKWSSLNDIAFASRWLKANYPSIENRVALSGRSFGGMMTMAQYAHFQDDFEVYTPTVSVSDPTSFLLGGELGWWAADDFGLKRDAKGHVIWDRKAIQAIDSWNPMKGIERVNRAKPMMAFSGEFDTRVDPDQTVRYVQALQAKLGPGAPVYMIEHEKIGHNGRAEVVDEAVFIARQFGINQLSPIVTSSAGAGRD